jgi:murein DD-endopeptidase MepM/ murein hydrolase activator NlpD
MYYFQKLALLAGVSVFLTSCSQSPAEVELKGGEYYGKGKYRPTFNEDPYASSQSTQGYDSSSDSISIERSDERKSSENEQNQIKKEHDLVEQYENKQGKQEDQKDAYNEKAFDDLEKELLNKDNNKQQSESSQVDEQLKEESPATIPQNASAYKIPHPLGKDEFMWPVDGEVIHHYAEGAGKFKEGIAVSAPVGTEVKAMASGEVIYVGNDATGFGKLVIIKHDGGFLSAYAHNNTVLVEKGSKVLKGNIISKVGKTGDTSSSRLYFSIRKGKMTIDPEKIL